MNQAAAVARIRQYVEEGGNLILTDEGLKLLEDLGVVRRLGHQEPHNAGHVDITTSTTLTEGSRHSQPDLLRGSCSATP